MKRCIKTKLMLLLLIGCLFCLSNCQKPYKTNNQDPQMPIIDILLHKNKTDQVEQDTVTPPQPPPPLQNETYEPFSSPDLVVTLKRFLNAEEYDFKNPEKGGYFFVPLQIRNNKFEYCVDQNLVQLDLSTNKETIHKGFFKNLSITAPLNVPCDWILADQNRYFYAESTSDGESIICKNADTYQIIWKTRLFQRTEQYNTYITNKMMQNEQSIFIAYEDNLTCYCLDKASGKIVWSYGLQSDFPYLLSYDPNWCESDKAFQSFHVVHPFSNGIVLYVGSHIDQAKLPKPKAIEGDFVEKQIVLSLEGRLVNILESEVLLYEGDRYFTREGYKSLLDDKLQWNLQEKITGYIEKFRKKNFLPYYLNISSNKLFYTDSNQETIIVRVYNKNDLKELWKQSFSGVNLKAAFEFDNHYHVLYEKEGKGFLSLFNAVQNQSTTIPIEFYTLPVKPFIEYKAYTTRDTTYIVIPDGVLSFNNQSGYYQPYLTKQESENYYITQNINEPYFFENQDYIVVSFTPIENNRGGSRGGAILILKKQ